MARILKTAKQMMLGWKVPITCTGHITHTNMNTFNSGCYYLIEINARDIIKVLHNQGECEPEYSYGFICPNCKFFTEIDEKDIPYFIRENIKSITITEFRKKHIKTVDNTIINSFFKTLNQKKKNNSTSNLNLSQKNF